MIYPTVDSFKRHPSQVYEAFFEGIILFLIMIFLNIKNFKINNFGVISSIFLITYSIMRFFIEFLREPDLNIGLIFNFLTMGQILCIPMILFGILIYVKKK